MSVDKYSKSIQKNIEKLLKKMFGYKDVKKAISDMKSCRRYLENAKHKSIENFTVQDIRGDGYMYAKYRTLKRITDLYLESVSFSNFTIKEYEEYCK